MNTRQVFPQNSGQAAMIAVFFFLFISLVIAGAVGYAGVSSLQSANDLLGGKKSYINAESGVEDISYRIVNGVSGATQTMPLSGYSVPPSSVLINGGNTRVDVSYDGVRYSITSQGNIKQRFRTHYAKFSISTPEDGIGFDSALQAGFLGVVMGTGSGDAPVLVNADPTKAANMRSNGTINAAQTNFDVIKGNVTVAAPIGTTADPNFYVNNSPSSGGEFKLGDLADNSHDFAAQSFIAPVMAPVVRLVFSSVRNNNCTGCKVGIKISRNLSNPDRPDVSSSGEISRKDFDVPSGTTNNLDIQLSLNAGDPTAVENVKYWIFFDASQNNCSNCSPTKYVAFAKGSATFAGVAPSGPNICYGETWCNNSSLYSSPLEYAQFKYLLNPNDLGSWTAPDPLADITDPVPGKDASDVAFKIYFGESNATYGYRTRARGVKTLAPEGDARADIIDGSNGFYANIIRNAYFNTLVPTVTIGGSQTSPTSLSPPLPLYTGGDCGDAGKPMWQSCVSLWKSWAASGGETATKTIPQGTSEPLGPKKINGNLVITNGTLTITGAPSANEGCPALADDPKRSGNKCYVVWVTGYGDFSGANCTVKIDDMDKSAYLIFDGNQRIGNKVVNIQDNCKFLVPKGSKGHIVIISTFSDPLSTNPDSDIILNDAVNAQANIDAFNNSSPFIKYESSGIFFAPIGEVVMSRNATVTSLSGAHIKFLNGTVNYKAGVIDSASPMGTMSTVPDFEEYHEIE